MRTNRIFIVFIVLFSLHVFLSCNAQSDDLQEDTKTSLHRQLAVFLKNPSLENATVGFYAQEVKTGKVLAEFNAKQSMTPASVQKIITTATALELLGGDFRFKTQIQHSGFVDSTGRLHGNIYIQGGGDPTLASSRFPTSAFVIKTWVAAIQKKGIKSIEGKIIANAQIYENQMIPGTWVWEDVGNYYGAGACGLSIYENVYQLSLSSDNQAGGKTKIQAIKPFIPNIRFDNRLVASNSNRDLAYIYGAPYSAFRTIRGSIPKGRRAFKIRGAIPDPAYLTAFELEQMLKKSGISIAQKAISLRLGKDEILPPDSLRHLIYESKSPKLSEIVQKTNMHSINLYAEHLLNHLSVSVMKQAERAVSIEILKKFWEEKGMNISGLFLFDGSGLSHYNALNVRHLCYVLRYMKKFSTNKNAFVKSLPIAGKSGTLRYLLRNSAASGKISAKSGSLSNVRAYAGYATTLSGKEIAFALIVNNYGSTWHELKPQIEKLLFELVR